ncbi:MAG: chemotaxis protein CheW [Bryobacteraceae bacterium]
MDDFRSGFYLTFRVGRQEFAMEAGPVKAILPAHELLSLDDPDPEWLVGEAKFNGETFPVIDLRAKLNLRHGISGRTPCIVAVDTDGLKGFLADAVTEIVHARAHDYRNGKLRIGRPRTIMATSELNK